MKKTAFYITQLYVCPKNEYLCFNGSMNTKFLCPNIYRKGQKVYLDLVLQLVDHSKFYTELRRELTTLKLGNGLCGDCLTTSSSIECSSL